MRKKYWHQKRKAALLFSCLLLSLAGCSSASQTAKSGQEQPEGQTEIGTIMTAHAPQEFTLLDNKDALAADGLYYATWGAGNSAPYENSDGETLDLYDAQLYLLAGEAKSEKDAEKSRQAWLAAAKDNYKIHTTDTITCNGQTYTLISYDCAGTDTPYDHGVSALGVCGTNAVCAELTCTKDYDGDLAALLKNFLNNCQYIQ